MLLRVDDPYPLRLSLAVATIVRPSKPDTESRSKKPAKLKTKNVHEEQGNIEWHTKNISSARIHDATTPGERKKLQEAVIWLDLRC